jgi:hypothetical protein
VYFEGCVEEWRGAEGFMVKPGGKKQLGRPRHIWEENNKMDLQEVEGKGGVGLD